MSYCHGDTPTSIETREYSRRQVAMQQMRGTKIQLKEGPARVMSSDWAKIIHAWEAFVKGDLLVGLMGPRLLSVQPIFLSQIE